MGNKSKVLVFDIETLPLEVYVWDLREQRISLEQIKEDWTVASFAAKWLGEKELIYKDQRNARHIRDDRELLKAMWKLLDEADIVITQNGKKFDSRKLNARFIMHGMKPPSPYTHFDTFLCTNMVAEFTSHKLDYLTDKVNNKYKKLHHKNFPGWSLWTECLKGNKKAWDEMKVYNINDVLSTEELYMNVRAWAPKSFPKIYDVTDKDKECQTCGHLGRMRLGNVRHTKTYSYRQNACLKCGAWQSGEKIPTKKAA